MDTHRHRYTQVRHSKNRINTHDWRERERKNNARQRKENEITFVRLTKHTHFRFFSNIFARLIIPYQPMEVKNEGIRFLSASCVCAAIFHKTDPYLFFLYIIT